jgi:hypothetical protein
VGAPAAAAIRLKRALHCDSRPGGDPPGRTDNHGS